MAGRGRVRAGQHTDTHNPGEDPGRSAIGAIHDHPQRATQGGGGSIFSPQPKRRDLFSLRDSVIFCYVEGCTTFWHNSTSGFLNVTFLSYPGYSSGHGPLDPPLTQPCCKTTPLSSITSLGLSRGARQGREQRMA